MIQQNLNDRAPKISVCCIAYNHEKYIRDAIEGFLLQKTSFPIEIIIHDDASTDGTAEIIKKYTDDNPGLIIPILQTKNQYSKEGFKFLSTYIWPRARGKYIALCEGDDYWTDPYKLQKQFDFMEKNLDCSLCFHATKRVYEDKPERNSIHKPKNIPDNGRFEMKHVILGGGGFMATNSMFFLRRYFPIKNLPDWVMQAPVGDSPLMLLLASKGKIGYIDEVMSVYRIMSTNSWSASMKNFEKRKKHYLLILKMWNKFDEWSNKKYSILVLRRKFIIKCFFIKFKLKRLLNICRIFS